MALLQDLPAHSIAMLSINGQRASRLLVANTLTTTCCLTSWHSFPTARPPIAVSIWATTLSPILGTGSAVIAVNEKQILIRDCLHVTALCNPLYSLRAHQHQHGCNFLACTIWVSFSSFPRSSWRLTLRWTVIYHTSPLLGWANFPPLIMSNQYPLSALC